MLYNPSRRIFGPKSFTSQPIGPPIQKGYGLGSFFGNLMRKIVSIFLFYYFHVLNVSNFHESFDITVSSGKKYWEENSKFRDCKECWKTRPL